LADCLPSRLKRAVLTGLDRLNRPRWPEDYVELIADLLIDDVCDSHGESPSITPSASENA
jgi:hypothetical protein